MDEAHQENGQANLEAQLEAPVIEGACPRAASLKDAAIIWWMSQRPDDMDWETFAAAPAQFASNSAEHQLCLFVVKALAERLARRNRLDPDARRKARNSRKARKGR